MSLLKSAFAVSSFTLLSRVTGLAREQMIAVFFGASAFTDAFNVAFRIPNLLRRIFAEGAFSQAFVPLLAQSKTKYGDKAAQTLIDHVATVLFWTLLVVTLVGIFAAPLVVWAMASGLARNADTFASAVWMTRLMFPYIFCMSLVALAGGVLNTYRKFSVPAFTPVLLNLSMIGCAWLFVPVLSVRGILPIYSLACGVVLGGILQLGLQWIALRRLGRLPRLGLAWGALRCAWQDTHTRQMLHLMGPALLGVSAAQISLLINTQIASYLQAGSVSWISYADRLMEFPVALIGVALGVVLMPQLSAAKVAGDRQQYSAMLDWGLRLILLLGFPCALALIMMPEALVSVLFHYGQFSASDVRQTSVALIGWGVGLLGLLAIKILAPAYYAGLDTKTPVRVAFGVLLLTQAFNALLVPYFAHAALTLSIGLGALLNALWLLLGLLRKGAYQPRAGWPGYVLKLLLANALLAVLLWSLAGDGVLWLDTDLGKLERIARFSAIVLVAMVCYVGVLYALRLPLYKVLRGNA